MSLIRRLPSFAAVPLALACTLAFAPAAQAQSLLQLVDLARAHDSNWQAAQLALQAAQSRSDQAYAGFLPTAGLSGAASQTELNVGVAGLPSTQGQMPTQNLTLNASQPLYRPANRIVYEQSKRNIEIAGAQRDAAWQDLLIRTSQAYFDVLAAQDTLGFVQAQKKSVSEQLEFAKRNFEVGASTITDTYEAQARYDLVLSQEIAADNDLRVKRLALDEIVGSANTQPLAVVQPLVLPDLLPQDVQSWVLTAQANQPAIRQAQTAWDVAKLETDKAQTGHLPTVDLQASLGFNRYPKGSITAPGQDYRTRASTVGVAVNVPLFAGFAVQNRVKETVSLEEKARTDLETAQRNVAQTTRAAFFGVQSGKSQVKALEAAEASSLNSMQANQLGYEVGVRISIDVLNAQSQLFQTRRDLAQARYNVLLGQLKLRQAAGTLTEDDVRTLDQAVIRH